MRRAISFLAIVILVSGLGLAPAARAADHTAPGVAVQVPGSVKEALGKIKKMVADNGMMVMGELHQGKILAMTGLKVESESIFVGSPTVGKQLFSEDLGAGLVVPVRINIYRDGDGHTVVAYVPPSEQLGGFKNEKINGIAKMLDGKLGMMTQMLAK